jgi:hypothetical protein
LLALHFIVFIFSPIRMFKLSPLQKLIKQYNKICFA